MYKKLFEFKQSSSPLPRKGVGGEAFFLFFLFFLQPIYSSAKVDSLYINPIIHADFSDPDVVAVNDTFYMTASSFNCIPGLPILASTDLVHWQLIGHAINKLEPVEVFNKPQHGKGVWAPSIRYYNGEFAIYYGDPDYGIFLVKSKKPTGPWSNPILVQEGKGLIDPCPLFDDDGKNYLVHAFAGSRAGIKSILVINRMNEDGTKTTDNGVLVFDGHESHPTIEGPKLYKRNGYYYIFAPAGGVKTGWQLVLRSKNIYGPYEEKIALQQGNSNVNGPHQGAWVETTLGESWFVHFQDKDAYGRIVHLQPMRWVNDWPEIGIDSNNDGIGEPVQHFTMPLVKKVVNTYNIQTSDEFNSNTLGLQWQWHANPQLTWGFSSTSGYYRLNALPSHDSASNLWDISNLLLQKFPSENFTATLKFRFLPHAIGERFGLVIMGEDYSYVAVEQSEKGFAIVQTECKNAPKQSSEVINGSAFIDKTDLYFRVQVTPNAVCDFYYSTDNSNFIKIGNPFTAKAGRWIGAKIGFFCLRKGFINDAGYVDIDWFRIE